MSAAAAHRLMCCQCACTNNNQFVCTASLLLSISFIPNVSLILSCLCDYCVCLCLCRNCYVPPSCSHLQFGRCRWSRQILHLHGNCIASEIAKAKRRKNTCRDWLSIRVHVHRYTRHTTAIYSQTAKDKQRKKWINRIRLWAQIRGPNSFHLEFHAIVGMIGERGRERERWIDGGGREEDKLWIG